MPPAVSKAPGNASDSPGSPRSAAAVAAAGHHHDNRLAVKRQQGQQQPGLSCAEQLGVRSASLAHEAADNAIALSHKKHCGVADDIQQQQQQQGRLQSQQQADIVALLAVAAAAVPAPALQGPCLRLQQLLQYALALLCAVIQPMQVALAQGSAAAAAVAAAVERQLQQATLLLEQATQQSQQQLQTMAQQGYQSLDQVAAAVTAAAATAGQPLHEVVVQAGLQLVQLCALLLNDAAAGTAVAAQLTANAGAFAADAVGYLVQAQLGAAVGLQQQSAATAGTLQGPEMQLGEAGVQLQQMKAAQQHLQLLVNAAAQQR
jgi:hypothetical protein